MITLLILAIMIGIILLILGAGLSVLIDPIICILIIVGIYKCIKKIRSKKVNGD